MENLKTLSNLQKEVNGLTTRTINFKKENDKIFHIKDIKNMVKSLDNQYKKNKNLKPQYVVRGMNRLGVFTIKPSEKDIEFILHVNIHVPAQISPTRINFFLKYCIRCFINFIESTVLICPT